MSSALQFRRRLLPSSQAKVFVLQRSDMQRKDVVIMALRTLRRWVSSLPPPAAPPSPLAPAGHLSTDSESDSGRTPATSHSGVHSINAHVVTQFFAPVESGSWRAQGRFGHRRRRRHGAATSGKSSTECIEAATSRSASGVDAALAVNDPACMRAEPPCASPLLHTSARDAHSAMSPVQQRLCQLIGAGAWREALEVLRCHEQQNPTATHHAQASRQASSASGLHLHRASAPAAAEDADDYAVIPFMFVSLQEVSVWLLLWCGHGTAAWHVWRRIMQAVSMPSSPRLALLLALFTYVVERDTMRTRDMLLLLEMMNSSATTPPSEVKIGQMCEENPAPPLRVWRHLFWQWLWCCNECTDPSKSPSQAHRHCLASFLEGAVGELTKFAFWSSATPAGQHMGAMTESVALLLLALRDVYSTSDEWQRLLKEELTTVCDGKRKKMSSNSCRSASAVWWEGSQEHPPLLSPSVCALMSEVVEFLLVGSSSTADDVRRDDGERADEQGHMQLRTIFSNAARNLKRLRGHCSSAVPENGGDALEAFRMWHERIVENEGLGGTWEALRLAMRSPPAQSCPFRLGQPTTPDDAAGISLKWLLQRIDDATAQGDWTTALRLCLNYSFPEGRSCREDTDSSGVETQDLVLEAVKGPSRCHPSTSTPLPADPFSFFHRLGKGLVACEVARPSGASWQGALALWNFARQSSHHRAACASPSDIAVVAVTRSELLHIGPRPPGPAPPLLSLSRALGRIFFLLASAGRWAEALGCFHETPDVYLDGFVVSQVAYALRDCPSQSRAVLDLWAAWRCRVGDAVDPTEMMTYRLLNAMLHTSVKATSPVASLSSPSYQSPAMVAAKVATAVLIAAADTSPAAPSTLATDARHAAVTPGTAVPLDWSRRRCTIRGVVADRWVGSWADALRVALASCDVSLLVQTVLRCAPAAHSPKLYSDVRRILQEKGVVLSPAERATLLALWGEGRRSRLSCDSGVGAGKGTSPAGEAVPSNGEGGGARQHVLETEAFLDELLGLDLASRKEAKD
ncbi:conserved hypothetical protein [Leishmania major strain Friedlin]|uniref:Uncharacterized protein n=1 Tax=Leishmania major TaxID=5664 RepID=Q4QFN4_LEIMA|nr:conserved hypothetical protein [Leishmania major strain Friedlin]CAJ03152.1 conserved hypothetical protein [Leishmania major strain Friedlin]|eukprot:XP_001687700.1 conserved hypothetical protein [Leishmania major strain Friedlin]